MINNWGFSFFEYDIHDQNHFLFGYHIVDPDSDDSYTKEELEKMREDLEGTALKDLFHRQITSITPSKYPLQSMINLVQYARGECFWHETCDFEDINVYFCREMLEEMRESGFKYMARIKPSEQIKDANKDVQDFILCQSEQYGRSQEYMRELFFDYEECDPEQLLKMDFEYENCDPSELAPRLKTSIFFSTVPIVSKKHEQLLKPISSEIIRLKRMEEDANLQRMKQDSKQRQINEQKIKGMESYFRSQGCSEEQINGILRTKGTANQEVYR